MSEQIPGTPGPRLQPSASYSFTMRLHLPQQGGDVRGRRARDRRRARRCSARSTSCASSPTTSCAT